MRGLGREQGFDPLPQRIGNSPAVVHVLDESSLYDDPPPDATLTEDQQALCQVADRLL